MTRTLVVLAIPVVALSLSACTININVPSNPGFSMMSSEDIVRVQTEEIEEMNAILKGLNNA